MSLVNCDTEPEPARLPEIDNVSLYDMYMKSVSDSTYYTSTEKEAIDSYWEYNTIFPGNFYLGGHLLLNPDSPLTNQNFTDADKLIDDLLADQQYGSMQEANSIKHHIDIYDTFKIAFRKS